MANPFADYAANINLATGVAKTFMPDLAENILKKSVPYDNVMKLIFNPDVRKYFDVSHDLVSKKVKSVVFPYFKQQGDQQLRKPELYIPLISLMTFILFSAFADGLKSETKGFNPNIGRKLLLCILFTFLQVIAAKCTRFAMSSIQMGVLDLTSFMSYRFVSLALSSITYAIFQIFAYFILAQTYFYFSQLKTYLQQRITTTSDLSNTTLTLIHFIVSAVLVFLL